MEAIEIPINDQLWKLHLEAQRAKEETIEHIKTALRRVIDAGRILNQLKTEKKGEFGVWLNAFIRGCKKREGYKKDFDFSQRTAYNYMRAAKLYDKKSDLTLYKNVKELYQAADIMPPDPAPTHEPKGPPPIFIFKFSAQPIEQWHSHDRLEFIERATPVVEFYNRCVALESSQNS